MPKSLENSWAAWLIMVYICLFLAAPQQLELPELFSHSGKNELLKLRLAESTAPRTALVVGPLGTTEVFIARGIVGRFECVPAFPALDFPGQPSVAGLAAILEGGVCHQLLAAPQPNISRCLGILATRKRVNELFQTHLVYYLVFVKLMLNVLTICFLFRPTVST